MDELEENKTNSSTKHPLKDAILDGNVSLAIIEVKKLFNTKIKPEKIVIGVIEDVMAEMDAKCTIEYFNLLEIMLAGRAIMSVMTIIFPNGIPLSQAKSTIVIGTIEGDIHDLGKNIVKMMLIGEGYRVVDCGKNCPIEELIDVTEKEAADALLISGLITTIIPQVQKVKSMLTQRHLTEVKIVAGGAALKQSSAKNLNVDFVAETVFDGLSYLNKLRG